MNLTMKVEGLDELNRRLNRLESKQIKKAVRSSAMFATSPMLKKMKSKVPVADGPAGGPLKKSLGRQSRFFRRGQIFSMRIGIRSKQSPDGSWPSVYGPMIENGTLKMAAQPFMRPAFDENYRATIDRFGQSLGEKVAQLAEK